MKLRNSVTFGASVVQIYGQAWRLALLVPDIFQLVVDGLTRWHGLAVVIREQEGADGERDASPTTSTSGDTKEPYGCF